MSGIMLAIVYFARIKVGFFILVPLVSQPHYVPTDCDEDWPTPEKLVAHCDEKHKGDKLRPGPAPFTPSTTFLPPVPPTLPSYMVLPRDVRQASITRERHAVLGPWVSVNTR